MVNLTNKTYQLTKKKARNNTRLITALARLVFRQGSAMYSSLRISRAMFPASLVLATCNACVFFLLRPEQSAAHWAGGLGLMMAFSGALMLAYSLVLGFIPKREDEKPKEEIARDYLAHDGDELLQNPPKITKQSTIKAWALVAWPLVIVWGSWWFELIQGESNQIVPIVTMIITVILLWAWRVSWPILSILIELVSLDAEISHAGEIFNKEAADILRVEKFGTIKSILTQDVIVLVFLDDTNSLYAKVACIQSCK